MVKLNGLDGSEICALQIQKGQAGDMRRLVVAAPALDTVRPAGACLVDQIGRAVEDAECRIGQMFLEPLRADMVAGWA
jgi:hypothetical protein